MDKLAETSILFDLYGGLLTEKKRQVMELYHEENLSLSEIAEEKEISRAAVYDALKSAEKKLNEYESKLGLAKDYMNRVAVVESLREIIKEITWDINNSATQGKRLKKIEELLSTLEE